jgi:hypothetical protein
MRFAVVILSAAVGVSAQHAPRLSLLDEPMTRAVRVDAVDFQPTCALWTALEQLARQARVRIGFEHTLSCAAGGVVKQPDGAAMMLDGLTPRQAFDRLLSHRPDYSWTELDGVVVIRPTAAWAADGSVLNSPVAAIEVAGNHVHHALHTVLRSTQPSLFQEHTDLTLSTNSRRLDNPESTALIDTPVTMTFAGGTVVQALNEVTRHVGGSWQVGYTAHGDGLRSLRIILLTREWDGGTTQISSVRFTPKPTRRR